MKMNMMRILALLLIVAMPYGHTSNNSSGTFKLLVLHTNDMHARFEQTNRIGGKCRWSRDKSCYGGFARISTAVQEIRRTSTDHVLFLNAGDTYQGTVWYTAHKWSIVARFTEILGLDAMCLGNHEFDEGVEGLVPFLQNTTIPIVVANIDASEEPELLPFVQPSVVLNLNNTLVGVIGYLTPSTKEISLLGKVKLLPEVECVAKEAARLRSAGVKILIALGHSGYITDKDIARHVPDIDLVVGGHTNTFLYTGTPPDIETPVDEYPKIILQQSGRTVLVVQAYAFTKYLGYLEMAFNEDGELVDFGGNPILMNAEVSEDKQVLKELERWYPAVEVYTKETVGMTRVYLDGSQTSCRNVECNLGNLIADAMVFYHFEKYTGEGWSDGAIAIQHGGGIRTSIEETIENGTIVMEDMLTVLPFENPVLLVQLSGKHIIEMLEFSASFHDPNGRNRGGGFLQLSGLYVRYNMSKPVGNRTLEIKVRCAVCRIPTLHDINPNKIYSVLMPTFLAEGGDGYNIIKSNILTSTVLGHAEFDLVQRTMHSPAKAKVQNTILVTMLFRALVVFLGLHSWCEMNSDMEAYKNKIVTIYVEFGVNDKQTLW